MTNTGTPTYKLHYFNVKGLAEPIRFLFAYGRLPYEDIRIEYKDWPAIKHLMPLGQMPVLEIDGEKIHQSVSIARYIGKTIGLAGNNDYENLKIDVAADTVNDFRLKLFEMFIEQDQTVKEKKRDLLKTHVIPFFMEKLETTAEKNNGHLALSRLTWADFLLAGLANTLNHMAQVDVFTDFPNLRKVIETIYEFDAIKEWMEKRPVTNF